MRSYLQTNATFTVSVRLITVNITVSTSVRLIIFFTDTNCTDITVERATSMNSKLRQTNIYRNNKYHGER